MSESTKYRFNIDNNAITVDLVSMTVQDPNGKNLGITGQGFKLLSFFVRAPKKLHTKEDLRALLWGKNSVAGNLNNAISALRTALQEKLGTECEIFENKPGIGYLFKAKVEKIGLTVTNRGDEDARRIEKWSKRWEYLQKKEFTGLSVFLHLSRPIGREKFVELLAGSKVRIGEGEHTAMRAIYEEAPPPNSIRSGKSNDTDQPIISFWERYDDNNSVCRRGQDVAVPDTVTGLDIWIPWHFIECKEVNKLCELYTVQRFGIAIDEGLMRVGLEECAITFEGKEFSFRYSMLDEGALGALRGLQKEFRKAQTASPEMPLYWTESGARLLDQFYQSHLPQDPESKSDRRELGIFRGLAGPEKDISFYPDMPRSFHDSEEHGEFSFTVKLPSSIDWEARVTECRDLLSQDPTNVEYRSRLAYALRESGDSGEALDVLQETIDSGEFHLPSFELKAHILFNDMGLNEDALETMQQVANHEDDSVSLTGHIGCAAILQRTGKGKKALSEHIDLMIECGNVSANLFEIKGRILCILDRSAEAITAFKCALELDENHVWSLVCLGLLEAERDIPKATNYFERAVKTDPESSFANEHFGRFLYHKVKDESTALHHLERAVSANPNDEALWAMIYASANGTGDLDRAETAARNAVQINNTVEHCTNLGIILANKKEHNEALKWFQRALDKDPCNEVAEAYKEAIKSEMQN